MVFPRATMVETRHFDALANGQILHPRKNGKGVCNELKRFATC